MRAPGRQFLEGLLGERGGGRAPSPPRGGHSCCPPGAWLVVCVVLTDGTPRVFLCIY